MNLTLIGHDDRYAVEQLQLALFAADREGQAVSTLHRGKTWLTASTKITYEGRTAAASRRTVLLLFDSEQYPMQAVRTAPGSYQHFFLC